MLPGVLTGTRGRLSEKALVRRHHTVLETHTLRAMTARSADREGAVQTPSTGSPHPHLLANRAVTAVRRPITPQLLHRRGPAADPAWANRRLLLCGSERLPQRARARMWNSYIGHDPTTYLRTRVWFVFANHAFAGGLLGWVQTLHFTLHIVRKPADQRGSP